MQMNSQSSGPAKSSRRKAILAATAVAGTLALTAGVYLAAAPLAVRAPASDLSSAPVAAVSSPRWDRAHRNEFVQLKSKGDALAMEGKVQAAYDAYQRCVSLISDHELTDPVVICTVKSAQENQTRLMLRIVDAEQKPTLAASGQDAGPAAIATASVVAISTPVQPLLQPPTDKQATSRLENQPVPRAATPNDRGTDKLFDDGTRAPRLAPQASGSVDTSLGSDPALPSLFQPFEESDPGPGEQPVVPLVTLRHKPAEPAAPGGIAPGTPTQTVYVAVKARPPGSPPVTGNVDGQPFSIGAGGTAAIEAFTAPAGSIPVTVAGQNYIFNGVTLTYIPPSSSQTSTSASSSRAETPVAMGPVQPGKTTPVPPTHVASRNKGNKLQSAF